MTTPFLILRVWRFVLYLWRGDKKTPIKPTIQINIPTESIEKHRLSANASIAGKCSASGCAFVRAG
jgi:hypothetical protein